MLHVFFDLDGTLTHSADGITRCIEHALCEVAGASPLREQLTRFIGTPLVDIFRELLETDDAATLERASACYVDRFYEVGIRENEFYPGVLEGLGRLRALDVTLNVATAKTPRAARDVVDLFELGGFFDAIHAVDYEAIPDKAALLCEAVARGVRPEQAIMVGDRHHDIGAGRAAGMTTVWAGWGYGSPAERDECKPHHSAEDFGALTEWIEGRAI